VHVPGVPICFRVSLRQLVCLPGGVRQVLVKCVGALVVRMFNGDLCTACLFLHADQRRQEPSLVPAGRRRKAAEALGAAPLLRAGHRQMGKLLTICCDVRVPMILLQPAATTIASGTLRRIVLLFGVDFSVCVSNYSVTATYEDPHAPS
jgi:hypothetical protein